MASSDVELSELSIAQPVITPLTSLGLGVRRAGGKEDRPKSRKIESVELPERFVSWEELGVPLTLRIACGVCGCFEPKRQKWSAIRLWRIILCTLALALAITLARGTIFQVVINPEREAWLEFRTTCWVCGPNETLWSNHSVCDPLQKRMARQSFSRIKTSNQLFNISSFLFVGALWGIAISWNFFSNFMDKIFKVAARSGDEELSSFAVFEWVPYIATSEMVDFCVFTLLSMCFAQNLWLVDDCYEGGGGVHSFGGFLSFFEILGSMVLVFPLQFVPDFLMWIVSLSILWVFRRRYRQEVLSLLPSKEGEMRMKGEHFFDIVKMIELDERNVAGKIVEEEKEWVPADEFLSARNALCRSLRAFSDGLFFAVMILNLKYVFLFLNSVNVIVQVIRVPQPLEASANMGRLQRILEYFMLAMLALGQLFWWYAMASLAFDEREVIRRVSVSTVWKVRDVLMVLEKIRHDPFCLYVLGIPITVRTVNAIAVASITSLMAMASYIVNL